ncbi:MAG: HEAT repeat domain-containing protein, partial [Anaerolineales bacterium]|nr:HEAT repeat domain-containing protein [Anaerolineales bacterium]
RALLEDLEDLSDKDDLLLLDDVGKIGLFDADSIVITNAIRLLWHAEDKKLVPTFIQYAATHADEGVRATSASILGTYVYMGEIESIPTELHTEIEETLLLATRKDVSELVRRRALEALGYSSRDEVTPLIRSAYTSKDTLWLESALYAMGRSADNQWDSSVLKMIDH